MKDRVPTRPGRMKITPEDGSPAYYATVEMADEPSEVGTALNKSSLLSDSTASALGLNGDPTPNSAFSKLKQLIDSVSSTAGSKAKIVVGSYIGTGTSLEANPTRITFPATPAVWGIIAVRLPDTGWVYPVSLISPWNPKITGATKIQKMAYTTERYGDPFNIAQTHITYTGSTVSWWSDAEGQHNILNAEYYYFGIIPG